MPEPKKTRKPRVVRTPEQRLADNEAQNRVLKAKIAAGENEDVQALLRASTALRSIRSLGKKDADGALGIAREALAKALAALGF